jgi:hypothetical protein
VSFASPNVEDAVEVVEIVPLWPTPSQVELDGRFATLFFEQEARIARRNDAIRQQTKAVLVDRRSVVRLTTLGDRLCSHVGAEDQT